MNVIEMGGNAVLGYQQYYDLEGEGGGGIVARGYGTCCLLSPSSVLLSFIHILFHLIIPLHKSFIIVYIIYILLQEKKKEEGEEGEEGNGQIENMSVPSLSSLLSPPNDVFRFDKNFTDVSVKLITLTYIPNHIPFQFCGIVSVYSLILLILYFLLFNR